MWHAFDIKNAYKFFVGHHEWMKPLKGPTRTRKDPEMDLKRNKRPKVQSGFSWLNIKSNDAIL
jgi:hypothetical protein